MKFFGCLTVLLSVAVGPRCVANLLTNPDFQVDDYAVGVVNIYDQWGWDPATIVSAERGLTPHSGTRMLRIDGTSLNPNGDGTGGTPYQFVSLLPYAALVDAGELQLRASYYANRVAGDSETDTEFVLTLRAYIGDVSQQNTPEFGKSGTSLMSDSDPSTWEKISLTWQVPAGTDYLGILPYPVENVHNDIFGSGQEFDGHYIDSVTLEVIPEPGVFALWIVGLAVLRRFLQR